MRENNGTRYATDAERRNVAVVSAVAVVIDLATLAVTKGDLNVTGVVAFATAVVCVGYAAVIELKHRIGRRRSR
ncbi:hypothetical protein ACQPZP_36355 [Spirillospora sp. CA-142024]|uniref:hypothetical protein n=1 Tax=Spirillospora sp. CA-142024 TaxID=3240036 RepID=UPI003D94187B